MLEPTGSKRVELMLDYFPNADHAGIYAAQANGDFQEAGLDVEIRQPPDPAAPIKQVAAGRVDLAISYEPEVLRARDQGLAVVSVAALVQKPLTSIISLPKAKICGAGGPEGQDRRHGRDRLPGRLPEGDPGRGGRRPRIGQGPKRRLRLQPGAHHRQDRRSARRVLELRGPGAEAARQAAADHPDRRGRRARPTTSSCWWRTRTRSSATATRSAPSSARSHAGRATCAATRTRRSRACSTPTRTSIRSCSAPP